MHMLSCAVHPPCPAWCMQVWDLKAGQLLRTQVVHRGMVTCLAYAFNVKLLFSGSIDGSIAVWTDKGNLLQVSACLCSVWAAAGSGRDACRTDAFACQRHAADNYGSCMQYPTLGCLAPSQLLPCAHCSSFQLPCCRVGKHLLHALHVNTLFRTQSNVWCV